MARLRIGLLTDDLQFEGTYQDMVWRVASDLAVRRGFDLLVFPGHGSLQPGNPARGHLPMYLLAISAGLDGLVLSPTAGYAMNHQELDDVLTSAQGMPLVTFAQAVKGLPVIMIDNKTGTTDLLEHLITVHGKKRIAMMRAPEMHPEALARYEAWKAVMTRHGLPHEESMTVMGDFELAHLPEQIRSLLDQSGGFDALFCCNDRMAIASMEELRRLGWRIPEDIAVCGYDDIGRGLTVSPPLTTVHQPVILQIASAFDLLIRTLEGKTTENRIELPSRLVVRGSCGCRQESWSLEVTDLPPGPHKDSLQDTPPELLLQRVLKENPPETEVLSLIHRLRQLDESGNRDLLASLDRYFRDRSRSRLIALQNKLDQLISLERYFTITMTRDELKTCLTPYLEALGIRVISLSLTGTGIDSGGAHALEERPDGSIARPPLTLVPFLSLPEPAESGEEFNAAMLAPGEWWSKAGAGNFVVLPLVAGNHWFGLMVANLDEENSLAIRGLQEQLASHFYRNWEFQRLMRQALDHELKVRVEQEKMRAMTTLVAGVAHEINTPLGNGILGISHLQALTAKIQSDARDHALGSDALTGFLDESVQAQTIVEKGLMRVDRLVRTFKKVSTSNHEAAALSFDLPETLHQILEGMKMIARDKIIHFTTDFPPSLPVRTSQSALWEILQLLAENAAIHGYPEKKEVNISLSMRKRDNETVVLEFADQGAGIAAFDLPRIFEPFFSTLSSGQEGAGLGLHIVYNLITETMHGTIRCESTPGQGTRFRLEFPAFLQEDRRNSGLDQPPEQKLQGK